MILNRISDKCLDLTLNIFGLFGRRHSDLEDYGWRQHSFIDISNRLVRYWLFQNCKKESRVSLLPYSCAIVNPDYEKEPLVEVQLFSPAGKNDQFKYGRHPRYLQIDIAEGGQEGQLFQTSVAERIYIKRKYLEILVQMNSWDLPAKSVLVLQDWVCKRYSRQVMPSAFNETTYKARNKVRKMLATGYGKDEYLQHLEGVYLTLDPAEEIDMTEQPYEITISLLISEYGHFEHNAEFVQLQTSITTEFKKAKGIIINGGALLTASNVPYSVIKEGIRIDDFDYISFKDIG